MLNWLTRRHSAATKTRSALRLEPLESRELLSITINLNYSYDTGFFTNNPAAQAVMQQVATEMGNSISANLSAITPFGGNTWTATFFDPATGGQASVANLNVAANSITVFVGARAMTGTSEAGFGGFGGYSISGTQPWISSIQTRGWGGFAPWGGSITFDNTQNWFYGTTTAGIQSNQLDFYSVATHELGHILGIGTSTQWTNLLSGNSFVGANAEAVYGGAIPISSDRDHWAPGTAVNGQGAAMDPTISFGTRVTWSALDAAALRDLGWSAAASPPASPPPPAAAAPVALPPSVAFTGSSNGTLNLFTSVNGVLTATGQTFTPFAGYHGEIRVAAGDFYGDGTTDYAVTTGAGTESVIEILSGRDGTILLGPTAIFPGYTGGLYLAAGDIDNNGRDQLVVAAGEGAPPLIEVFGVGTGGWQFQSSFYAFNAPWFTGGIRVAVGDLNHDGFADLVVTTASMIGAVGIYNGAALAKGNAVPLFPFALPAPSVPLGLTPAVGDLNGDGYADLALTFGAGGPSLVGVWSGAILTQNPNTPFNQLPLMGGFLAFPTTDVSGARLAIRPLDGSGVDQLVVASGNPLNSAVRVFNLAAVEDGGANTPIYYPLGPTTIDGVFAAEHSNSTDTGSTNTSTANSNTTNSNSDANSYPTSPNAPTTEGKTYTVTAALPGNHCTCAACLALARLTNPDAAGSLVPSGIAVM